MAVGVTVIIGQILLEGMKLWSAERKNHFAKKYKKILDDIDHAENAAHPHYTDARLMRHKEELERFLEAYYGIVKEENNAKADTTNTNS